MCLTERSFAVCGDFDGDGRTDVIIRREDRLLLWRAVDGPAGGRTEKPEPFELKRPATTGALTLAPGPPAVGDFDGDGTDEVVLSSEGGPTVFFYSLKRPVGHRLRPVAELTASGWVVGTSAADIDADGLDDLLVSSVPKLSVAGALRILFSGQMTWQVCLYRGRRGPGRVHAKPVERLSVSSPLSLIFTRDQVVLAEQGQFKQLENGLDEREKLTQTITKLSEKLPSNLKESDQGKIQDIIRQILLSLIHI